MKKLLFIFVCCVLCGVAYAQEKRDSSTVQEVLPYMQSPTVPSFNIMLQDSSTIFNTGNIPKGKPIAIMFFDPDCKHCKAFTELLVKGMDSVKNVRFYMVTSNHNFNNLREFYKKYGLDRFKNISVVGRDFDFFFMTYYGAKSFPAIALYDANKNLVTLLNDVKSVNEIYQWTSKLKR